MTNKNTNYLSLSEVIRQSFIHFEEEFGCYDVKLTIDLEKDFLCKDDNNLKIIQGMTQIMFDSFCNIKFCAEKWIHIQSRSIENSDHIEVRISDSKPEVISATKQSLGKKLISLLMQGDSSQYQDKKFYNYIKHTFILNSKSNTLKEVQI